MYCIVAQNILALYKKTEIFVTYKISDISKSDLWQNIYYTFVAFKKFTNFIK